MLTFLQFLFYPLHLLFCCFWLQFLELHILQSLAEGTVGFQFLNDNSINFDDDSSHNVAGKHDLVA